MANDYKDKIRKLLALAESPNEHEAKAALLKARKLMAEHKLSEAELADLPNPDIRNVQTDITCSKRKHPWVILLSTLIGKNYCCKAYYRHQYRKQNRTICFIGLESDVEICVSIFRYAVDCVLSEIRRIEEAYASAPRRDTRRRCDNYGYGFVAGLTEAFRKQEQENADQWGLILSIPEEVAKASEHFKKSSLQIKQNVRGEEYQRGYLHGQEFDPSRRLARAETGIENRAG